MYHNAPDLMSGFQLSAILAEGKNISEERMLTLVLEKLKTPEVENYGKIISSSLLWLKNSRDFTVLQLVDSKTLRTRQLL